jgi:hypothetical protein
MSEETQHDASTWRPRVKLAFLAFALIGTFFLIAEHRAHVLPWLPWLFLAACPLMHVFMHHGHGGHDHRSGSGGSDGRPDVSPGPGFTGLGSTPHHSHGDRS